MHHPLDFTKYFLFVNTNSGQYRDYNVSALFSLKNIYNFYKFGLLFVNNNTKLAEKH
jgi:hypothetical protein